jgi:hypothetical protein
VSKINRHICLAILLGILVGHASFAVHAASHDDLDTSECRLCISYGDVSKALTSQPAHVLAPAGEHAVRIRAAAPRAELDVILERQRGPPLQH